MLSSIIVIAAIGALIYGIKRWQSLVEEERAQFSKKALIYAAIGIVLALVLAGRAHWLMGVLAALLALVGRVAQFVQYVPLFKKMMGDEPDYAQAEPVVAAGEMSKREAADLLGVEVTTEAEEVRMAHKRLMQKIHPDRGGSDALAKQINQAKEVLLS